MLTYVMVIEKLAGGCTNTGMTVHMHSTVMRFIEALGTAEQKSIFYPEIVDAVSYTHLTLPTILRV